MDNQDTEADVRIEDWKRKRRRQNRKSHNRRKARSSRDTGDDDAAEPDVDLDDLEVGTIRHACLAIGGKASPVAACTYYRGVARGIYNAPYRPSPGVSRVDLKELRERIRAAKKAAIARARKLTEA